ncbi:hypothetical protein JZ751_000751 [Albula glossodonta]|uniref:Uncharacterized protein n=1 Tax=Albula glossodonta TaxID=121402 RepID=A0A8T2PWT7_9TELE|nr:hypothetical protein JZ751_000751 [Albula glossodonta]
MGCGQTTKCVGGDAHGRKRELFLTFPIHFAVGSGLHVVVIVLLQRWCPDLPPLSARPRHWARQKQLPFGSASPQLLRRTRTPALRLQPSSRLDLTFDP